MVPDYVTEMLNEKMIPYEEVIRLESIMPRLDMLYMTRVQKERFFNEEDYVRLKDFYILDRAKMELASPDHAGAPSPSPSSMKSPWRWMTIPEPHISSRCSTGFMCVWL